MSVNVLDDGTAKNDYTSYVYCIPLKCRITDEVLNVEGGREWQKDDKKQHPNI